MVIGSKNATLTALISKGGEGCGGRSGGVVARAEEVILVSEATRRDTASASQWILPGLCMTSKLYSISFIFQRIRREAGPPSMVSFIVCNQRKAA